MSQIVCWKLAVDPVCCSHICWKHVVFRNACLAGISKIIVQFQTLSQVPSQVMKTGAHVKST